MPRHVSYNKQGDRIMGCAAYHRGIHTVPDLARETGIPYQTLHKRLSGDFGRTTADELRAIFRVAGMTSEEIAEVWR